MEWFMKCFSIDLDGTLLNSSHEISDENLEVIHALKKLGHEVILNTGRAIDDVLKIKEVSELQVPIFCINGSVLFSEKLELLYEATLSTDTFIKIYQVLKGLGVEVLVYTNIGGLPTTLPPLHKMKWSEALEMFRNFNYDSILSISNVKIFKMIALVHPSDIQKLREVKSALNRFSNLSLASSFPNNVEITSGEAHKGKAILRYQQLKGVTFEEIFAFGDGGNDLGQFEVATTSIAMANAPEEVKEKADMITKSNDENGFAYAVNELLNIRVINV